MDTETRSRCDRYLRYSRVKLHVAEYHLQQFESALNNLALEDWEFQDPPPGRLLAVYGHADACVFQLVGSFDAWACAAAWAVGLTEPDKASFAKLGDPQTPIRNQVAQVGSEPKWSELLRYRHLAAHRGVVATKRVLSPQVSLKMIIRTEHGEDVADVLRSLVEWARPRLLRLYQFARDSGWYANG